MSFKNSGFSNAKILDVLNDGEYHEFKIIKKCDYTEKQRKVMKYFKEEYNYYYRLSFVDENGNEKITDTTFYQPITKAISEELENYKKANHITSDSILYIIKIACVKTRYNNYYVEVVGKYKFEKKKENKIYTVPCDDYIKLFNNFKNSLKCIKYANIPEECKKEFIDAYTSEKLAEIENRVKEFAKFKKVYENNKRDISKCYNENISVFNFGTDRVVYKTIGDIINAMLKYDIKEVDSLHQFWLTDNEAFESKFSTHRIEHKYEGKNAFFGRSIIGYDMDYCEYICKEDFYKNQSLAKLSNSYNLCYENIDKDYDIIREKILRFCTEQAYYLEHIN